MLLYGASGHAKVIHDALHDLKIQVNQLFDDNELLGSFNNIDVTTYDKDYLPNEELIISIGNNKHRYLVAQKVSHTFGMLIHPSAIYSSKAKIGKGSIVLHNSTIQADSMIGNHVIINTACVIDHECRIGDYAHISPNATLCGNVTVGEGVQIGAGAIILPNIKIGKWSVIGAGAVINKDIPNNVVVVGNPGRILKENNNE